MLGGVGALLQPVVVVDLGGRRVGAVRVGLHLALGDGDWGAGGLGHLVAAALHAVGADVHRGGVVEDIAVPRDVHAVIVVAILVMVAAAAALAAREGGGETAAAEGGQ